LSTKLPYPLPNGYDPSGYWNNPSQTNPFPTPPGLPYQAWSLPRNTMSWVAPPTDPLDVAFTEAAYWQSPLFDLRPELRGSDGARQTGIPIWGALGKKLWVQISGLLDIVAAVRATDGLDVVSREYAEIYDPTQVARVSADAKITLDVAASGTSQPPSVVLPFYPPGSGTPVRYWRLEIAFRRNDLLNFPLVVSGAFY
jgi:hypothetical protein